MDDPNYRFNKRPRFSANQLAEYVCTTDAPQREAVIRKAKFSRKPSVVAYQQITPSLRSFLTGNITDHGYFDSLLQRLDDKAQREEGYNRDEALRCMAAVNAFLKTATTKLKMGKARFFAGPQDVAFNVSGVSVNARLDPPVIEERDDGRVFSGGCVLFIANSPEARKNIEERSKIVAAIVHWALGGAASNIEPLARLCMSFDAFGGEVVRAPASFDRLRKRVTASCREVFNGWDHVEPPAGYDGPNWLE